MNNVDTDATTAAVAASVFTANNLKGRYATALYEFAEEKHALNETITEVQTLLKVISESGMAGKILDNLSLDTKQSRKLVVGFLKEAEFSRILQNFVGVVANNRRLAELRSILTAFLSLVNLRRGVVVAEVITVHPLTDTQRAQLRDRFSQAGFNNVDMHERVDTELLGGIIIRIGSRLYDASLQSRLNRLNNVMKGAA